MPLTLLVSFPDYPAPGATDCGIASTILSSKGDWNSITLLIRRLIDRYGGTNFERQLTGWQGLRTWLEGHRENVSGICIVLEDSCVSELDTEAVKCIASTWNYVSWMVQESLRNLAIRQNDKLIHDARIVFPAVSGVQVVSDSHYVLGNAFEELDYLDCKVIRQVQKLEVKAWFKKLWVELEPLQPALKALVHNPELHIPPSDRDRLLDELRFYDTGKGHWTPLTLLFFSYVRTNHCNDRWRQKARCGRVDSLIGWLQWLVEVAYDLIKKTWLWIVLTLILTIGGYFVVSEFAGLTPGTALQLPQLNKLLAGVMLIVAAVVMVIKKLRRTLNWKYAARVIFISLLVIVLPFLQELYSFLLDRPIEIPILIWFLASFAVVALLLITVFADLI